jgi:hypothetical protein
MIESPYYDKNGVEIQEGDLLKVYHFRHYLRRRKMYMYHVAVIEQEHWAAKEYYADKSHYWLKAVADKDRIINGTEIIYKPDWENEEKFRSQGRKRLKKVLPF